MKKLTALFSLLTVLIFSAPGESSYDPLLHRALREELFYQKNHLSLEGRPGPFYLSAALTDIRFRRVIAVRGAVIQKRDVPYRGIMGRLMVGDYELNNENFLTYNNMFGEIGRFTGTVQENDPLAIRRSLWLMADTLYKEAVVRLEDKKSIMKECGMTVDETGPDFIPAGEIHYSRTRRQALPSMALLEETAKVISKEVGSEKRIKDSQTDIYGWETLISYVNTEGSMQVFPLSGITVTLTGYGLTQEGEQEGMRFRAVFPAGGEFPSRAEWIKQAREFRKALLRQIDASPYDDYYEGPVLFSGEAVSQLFASSLFGEKDPLIDRKQPLYYDRRIADADPDRDTGLMSRRLGRLVVSPLLTVKAVSGKEAWDGIPLVGYFPCSAEGVPVKEKTLISRGILKEMLSSRTPVRKGEEAGWHKRWVNPWRIDDAPGVVAVFPEQSLTKEALHEKLSREAEKNGYDYYISISSLSEPGFLDSLTDQSWEEPGALLPRCVEKVYADGRREPVRNIEALFFSPRSLKHLLGVTTPLKARNLVYKRNQTDIYASFIVPSSVAVEEMVITGKPQDGFSYEEYLPVD
ncbi:MAG TPA: metallopeptidase TldD-related protein [Candidatus Mcinerneyibacteriales bacterium]|nr:metallopeptidase TldD-related protein [Candidatus Mcinerneyibacteriales bacterium]HPE21229.1 metallopeptidase TldD-related protein [Candidatus Mcinerneyibacteriales bacterium]HPJ69902.1 metallopeptidase TldD-related protein [Candidatus Mcinerneyibacteriales bacterium]HPQ88633.1 metallopeptidase TldD-related protein [Candidatus Mcinerneyibacteriales bacterium]